MEGNKMRIKKLFPLLAMFTITFGAFGAFGQSYIPEDDIYYQPSDKNPVIEQKKKEKLTEQKIQQELVTTANQNRIQERNVDVDEYNRRTDSNNYPAEEVQSEPEDNRSVKKSQSTSNEDDGYYLNGFKGSDNDFEYSERIRRFQDPRFTILISDPGYNDIYMLNSSDWNVYIDNSAAWVTPTWTNANYWNYTWTPYNYNSFSWRWNFGMGSFGMSWGSPYYGSYWNRPWGYDPYYSWGWGGHNHWPHYGWGGYPNYGHHYPSWNNKPQPRPSRWGNSTGSNRNDNNGRYPVRNGTTNTNNGNSRYPTTTVNKNPITTNGSRPNVNQTTGKRTRITTQPTGTTTERPTSVNTERPVNNRTTYSRGSSDGYKNSMGNSSTPSRSNNSSTSPSYQRTTPNTATPSYNSGSSGSTRSSGSMSSGGSRSSGSSSGGGRRGR